MIQIAGSHLSQWDVGRSVSVSDSKATHVHFANQGDSKAPIIKIENGEAKIPDYLLQTGKALNAYAVLDGVTLESRSFAVCKRERPENYVYEDDRRNYIYELITRAEDAVEKLGSIVIPTKVSQLENDSGFLTEAPVTTTKVELTKQTDGSYLSDLSAADIMAAYKDHKTVHCYHNKMILPLIRSVVNDAVFGGIYDGQIHTVTVASNRVATVTVIPLSSGGGSDGITPHIGANGNWWIGEEDTGVSAGVTDEQISGAVEEYMEDNPLVKTVNGTAPDENGNVVLDIPSGGGGSSSSGGAFRLEMTLEKDVSDFTILLPVNWENILQFHVRMDNEHYRIASDMRAYMICGDGWTNLGTLAANTLALDIYGIAYQRWGSGARLFAAGVNHATNATDACRPKFPDIQSVATSDSNILRLRSETAGVAFPAGAHFEVWGVYAS